MCRILAKGASKEPAERYQTATEMLGELKALLAAPPHKPRAAATGPATLARRAREGDRGHNLSRSPSPPTANARAILARRASEWFRRIPPKRLLLIAVPAALLLALAIILLIPTSHGTVKIVAMPGPQPPPPGPGPAAKPAPEPAVRIETPPLQEVVVTDDQKRQLFAALRSVAFQYQSHDKSLSSYMNLLVQRTMEQTVKSMGWTVADKGPPTLHVTLTGQLENGFLILRLGATLECPGPGSGLVKLWSDDQEIARVAGGQLTTTVTRLIAKEVSTFFSGLERA